MKTYKTVIKTFCAVVLLTGMTAITIAAGGGGGGFNYSESKSSVNTSNTESLYQKGVKADKSGDYKTAIQYFQDALKNDSNNPEILNMLAHSQRKLGMIDDALANYKKALSIKPDFPDAREYLGEAYIQASLREIDILKGYGSRGEKQRKDLIEAFKTAASGLK